jgi:hypothetical protein
MVVGTVMSVGARRCVIVLFSQQPGVYFVAKYHY